MDYKQDEIIRVIQERIKNGTYKDFLPKDITLAKELEVNPKTLGKAIRQLVAQGILVRRRHVGTQIATATTTAYRRDKCIEIIFEGFTSIFSHPFWGEIWEAMLQRLTMAHYSTILTPMEGIPETGQLKLDNHPFYSASGRIVLGISEKYFLDLVNATRVPFITACDATYPEFSQISFDTTKAIHSAMSWLHDKGCRRIGFIGQTQSLSNPFLLNKFNAYIQAVQNFGPVTPSLIASTRPIEHGGLQAIHSLLKADTPDALLVAYDHQLPDILQVLNERKLDIPVIGCDGLNLPGIPSNRPYVRVPRQECGFLLAEKMIQAINTRRKPRSAILEATFVPPTDSQI